MTTRLRQSLYHAAEAGYYLFWQVLAFLIFGLPVVGQRAARHWFWSESGAVVLTYHELGGRVFARHLDYLKRHWQITTLDDLVTDLRESKNPTRSVVITFDDGYKSNYSEIFPLLLKNRAPATIYLVSGAIDTQEEFWWQSLDNLRRSRPAHFIPQDEHYKSLPEEQRIKELAKLLASSGYTPRGASTLSRREVKEMVASGLVTIGSHTQTHPNLSRTTADTAHGEIAGSKSDLESSLGIRVKHFSYPYGDYNASHTEICEQSGYVSAVTAIPGINTLKTNPYELRRILIRPDDTPPVLAMKITGLGHRLGMDILTIKHLRQRGVPV